MEKPTERELVRKAVDADLLGDGALFEPGDPDSPPGYDLVELIGKGGGGSVYLARDMTLERPVAIKFLADARPADIERFRREARFAARLNNPAIVQVFELGDRAEPPYIVMQYIDGGNLASARLDTAGVVRVVREIAVALRHAHAEGIVHRDIKPENILLDRQGHVFLGDFGIARSLDGALGDTISRDGQIIGTPGLMPPEQARGEVQAVDARSDVYAVGATLFVKLTGRYPFNGTNVVDVLHAVIHEPPPLLRAFNVSAPRGLEGIVHRCLQKSREDRYQSMGEVVDDLERFLGGELEGGRSAWFRQLARGTPGAPRTEPATADIESDTFFSEGLEIVRAIAGWDADRYRVTGPLTKSFERLDAIAGRLRGILAQRPDTAWARFYLGSVHCRRGEWSDALDAMERSIDRVKNQAGAHFELGRLYLAIYLNDQRMARRHLSRLGTEAELNAARKTLDQAVVALEEAQRLRGELPPWHEAYVGAVTHLAESDFRACVEACDVILGEDPDVEQVWKLRGDALHLAGEDPFESYDRSLEVRRSYFEALFAKAEAHLARGSSDQAVTALRRALEIHPAFSDASALLARTLLGEGPRDAADQALDEGRGIAVQALAGDPDHYDLHVVLAEIEMERGRRSGSPAALDAAQTALEQARHTPGCQNRIELLTARLWLERARQQKANGGDPRQALRQVVQTCGGDGARVPDNEPWLGVLREAQAELAELAELDG